MRIFIRILSAFCLLGLLLGGVAGCKRAASNNPKVFQAASPDAKAAWDKALAASGTNDFALAISTLQGMRQLPGLTSEQSQAVEELATSVTDRMYDAAGKGDAKAKQALDDLRALRGR